MVRAIAVSCIIALFVSPAIAGDVGRYQPFQGQIKYTNLNTGEEDTNQNLFLIDTVTGDVWVATHSRVVDSRDPNKETIYRAWDPFYLRVKIDNKTKQAITVETGKEFNQSVDKKKGN